MIFANCLSISIIILTMKGKAVGIFLTNTYEMLKILLLILFSLKYLVDSIIFITFAMSNS